MSKRNQTADLRKIQVTGGSTYIVSLPKTWIDQMRLQRGSIVSFTQSDDMSLKIKPKDQNLPEKIRRAIITLNKGDRQDSIIRYLISLYLKGYNIIEIQSTEKRIDSETRRAIKGFARRKLVGTEILSDLPNQLILQILLSYSKLSVKDALRRMSTIAISMHVDAIQTLTSEDPRVAKEIISMDDEVDRFSFYVIRLLNVAVVGAHVLKESGIETPQNCIGYRLITKSVERMADHATNIAENRLSLNLVPINEGIISEIERISDSAIKVFNASMESFYNGKYADANEVLKFAEETRGIEAEVIHKIIKLAPLEDVPQLRLIVESIVRTSEYGADIAESVLNMFASDAITEA